MWLIKGGPLKTALIRQPTWPRPAARIKTNSPLEQAYEVIAKKTKGVSVGCALADAIKGGLCLPYSVSYGHLGGSNGKFKENFVMSKGTPLGWFWTLPYRKLLEEMEELESIRA